MKGRPAYLTWQCSSRWHPLHSASGSPAAAWRHWQHLQAVVGHAQMRVVKALRCREVVGPLGVSAARGPHIAHGGGQVRCASALRQPATHAPSCFTACRPCPQRTQRLNGATDAAGVGLWGVSACAAGISVGRQAVGFGRAAQLGHAALQVATLLRVLSGKQRKQSAPSGCPTTAGSRSGREGRGPRGRSRVGRAGQKGGIWGVQGFERAAKRRENAGGGAAW